MRIRTSGGVGMTLRLGRREFPDEATLVMAIIDRTPDPWAADGSASKMQATPDRIAQAVAEGADVIDIRGAKVLPGVEVDTARERRSLVALVRQVRDAYPDLVISVETSCAEVTQAVLVEGADLIHDATSGGDTLLAVIAAHGAALICADFKNEYPRRHPHRLENADGVERSISSTVDHAERAVSFGVDRRSILIHPTPAFGMAWSDRLDLSDRFADMMAAGWPVVASLSHRELMGETLDLPVGERLSGTLAATAVAVLHGAQVLRVHDVAQTRHVVEMVSEIAGRRLSTV
ncbi:dihydropteroate synthase [Nocardioides sp. AN3]